MVAVTVSPAYGSTLPGTATNYALFIQLNGVTLAQCLVFSALAVGNLDLSTDAMIKAFSGKKDKWEGTFRCVVWDSTTSALVADDTVQIINNTAPTVPGTLISMGSLVVADTLNGQPAGFDTITEPTVVCIDANGKANMVIPSDSGSVGSCVGMCLGGAGGSIVEIYQRGTITYVGWVWTVGRPVYIGANGYLTQTPTLSQYVIRVGVALSTTSIWLTMWPGVKGVKGDTGTQGIQGIQGVQGIQGIRGVTGAAGAAGTNGNTWYSGNGAPAAGLGANGDYYFDTNAQSFYGKSAGAWSIIATAAANVDTVKTMVLDEIAAVMSDLNVLTDPTMDEFIAAYNALITRLKGL